MLKQSEAQHKMLAACLLFIHGVNHVQEQGTHMVLTLYTPAFNGFSAYKQGSTLFGDCNAAFHVQKVTPCGNATLVKLFLGTYSDEAINAFDATLLDMCLYCPVNRSSLLLLLSTKRKS